MRRFVLPLAALTALVGALAGCGGSSGSSKSADDWAAGYCSTAASWVTTLDEARKSAQAGTTTPSGAAQTVTDETNDFTQEIFSLGEPDTPDGKASASTAKLLTTQLPSRVDRITEAASTTNPSATLAQRKVVIQNQIAASLSDVASVTKDLAKGDAELATAMKASSDCTELNTALAKSGN